MTLKPVSLLLSIKYLPFLGVGLIVTPILTSINFIEKICFKLVSFTALNSYVLITSKLNDLIHQKFKIKPECENSDLKHKYEGESESQYFNGNIYTNAEYGMQSLLLMPMQHLARYNLFIDKFLEKTKELNETDIDPETIEKIRENLKFCQRNSNKFTKKFNKILGFNDTNPSLMRMSVVFAILDDKKSSTNLLQKMSSMRSESSTESSSEFSQINMNI